MLSCESWCGMWVCDGELWCADGSRPELCAGCTGDEAPTPADGTGCESWCSTWVCDGEWCANGEKPAECGGCTSDAVRGPVIDFAAADADADADAAAAAAILAAERHSAGGGGGGDATLNPAFGLVAPPKAGGHLPSWPMPIHHCSNAERTSCEASEGTWVGESWASHSTRAIDLSATPPFRPRGLAISGSTRMFYTPMRPPPEKVGKMQWLDVEYEKFELLGKSLSFTIDVSEVPCGCNAAVYLVQMDRPTEEASAYCDIQGFDDSSMEACTELDLIEGNQKGLQSTLHTAQGKGEDGKCNQDGCAHNWGRYAESRAAYGLPNTKGAAEHVIDSSRPMHITASFEHRRINW